MTCDVAIVGAGYVGLPLAQVLRRGRLPRRSLVDVAPQLVDGLNRGESHIEDVPRNDARPARRAGLVRATTDYAELREADAILIALPTPLSRQREPDLSIVDGAVARDRATCCAKGQVVVLESTT